MATETPETGTPTPEKAIKLSRDQFLHEHISGKSDREVLDDIAYHLYVYGQKLYALWDYVHQIETDAHEAMAGMMSPEGMAKAAAEFMRP